MCRASARWGCDVQRYHDSSRDPLPIRSAYHDQERQRIEQATAEFLAKGGQVRQIGYQMQDKVAVFVINPAKTPVYAHLFTQPSQPTAERQH